jgi:hypothetical protein
MKLVGCGSLGAIALGIAGTPAWGQQCSTDADCAAPLTCKSSGQMCSGGGTVLPDGGTVVTGTVCTPIPPVCTWTLQSCATDSECTQTHWACMQFPAEGASKLCYPEGIVCAAGQACPAGWSCVDFATVEEKDLVVMWSPSGETKYCFPDVLRGVADKTTGVDSSGINTGQQPGGSETPVGLGADAGNNLGSDDGVYTNKSSSGCSLGGSGHPAAPWCLFTGLLTLLLARPHPRRRRR